MRELTCDTIRWVVQLTLLTYYERFDTAEGYAGGKSEIEMGRVVKELNLRRYVWRCGCEAV
jgi:hypothetical protein